MFKIFGRVLNTPSIDMMICLTNVLLSDKNPDLYLLLKTVVVFKNCGCISFPLGSVLSIRTTKSRTRRLQFY